MTTDLLGLGKISEVGDRLLGKIGQVYAYFNEPRRIKRLANAESAAMLIKADAENEIEDEKYKRAIQRQIAEETRKQNNIENICKEAILLLDYNADPNKMDNDWIAYFFEKSRLFSDNAMQMLWSRILAGEANKAGSFSKRTISFVAELEKKDAGLFTKLCSYACTINDTKLVYILDNKNLIYAGLEYSDYLHLESIGLIKWDGNGGFVKDERDNSTKKITINYFDQTLEGELEEPKTYINIGHVILTQIGKELEPICCAKTVEGFFEYLNENWSREKQIRIF